VVEVRMAAVGPSSMPLLHRVCLVMRLNTGDVMVYKARYMGFSNGMGDGPLALPLVFLKVQHDIITRPLRSTPPVEVSGARIHIIPYIGNQQVIWVGGVFPVWIVVEKGWVTVLPCRLRETSSTAASLPSDNIVSSLTIASFPDVDNGFLVVQSDGQSACLSLCSADMGAMLGYTSTGRGVGSFMTARKVGPLGASVLKMASLGNVSGQKGSSPFYVMLVSKPARQGVEEAEEEEEEEAPSVMEPDADDDAEEEKGGTEEKEEERVIETDFTAASAAYGGAPALPEVRHQLWVVGGMPWGVVSVEPLKRDERGVCLTLFNHRAEASEPPTQYLAVGTGLLKDGGENVRCIGRILLFKVSQS